LGYKPTKEDKRRLLEEKEERILARIEGRERKIGKIHICDIKKSFRSAGWVNTCQISAIEGGSGSESLNFVRSCPTDVQLNNWEITNLPMMFNLEKM